MYRYQWNAFAPFPGLLAATLLAVGCGDGLSPELRSPGGPTFSVGSTQPAVTGRGAIGSSALAIPLMNRQEFDFDVTGTPSGRLFVRDFRDLRTNGSVGSLTADPAVDAATGISSFTQTSATCVAFGGIGRHDSGELMEFSVDACDNGSPGAGVDFFDISVRNYRASGTLTEGEITLSGGTTKGDVDVTTVSTGSDLDPDGYTMIVDGTMSQAIGTNATVRLNALAEGSHTVELSGVAANCTPSGENPRTVTVVAGSVASTRFDVSCTATTTAVTRVTGLGALGNGPALPKMDRFEFDFDVTSDLTGRVFVKDYKVVRSDGTIGQMTVDADADPETGITSFGRLSATCVRFGGIGRLDFGALYQFFIDACDYASPGVGADTFHITLPARGYSNGGTLTEGDIVISAP